MITFSRLFESGAQQRKLSHFAAIVSIAYIDGSINEEEKKVLFNLADKLNINENQFAEIVSKPEKYPLEPVSSKEERLEYIHDLFTMIYADHKVDQKEVEMIHRYAIGLGCSPKNAIRIIEESMNIFGGDISFEDYKVLMHNKESNESK
jgi:uncharacterized tellurite resistance protein B-like protein